MLAGTQNITFASTTILCVTRAEVRVMI